MRTRTTLTVTTILAVGALLGWLAASGRLATAFAQKPGRPAGTELAGSPKSNNAAAPLIGAPS